MNKLIHPDVVLYQGSRRFPALAACEHYAGAEKMIRKALQLQAEAGPVFDVTADCEDGAAAGLEKQHAEMVAAMVREPANCFARLGVRIHDISHPHWQADLDILIGQAGDQIAYIVLPKPGCADDAARQIAALDHARQRHSVTREIPVHVLIETHGALRDVWQIAQLPHVESIDFGLMDFVSAHYGAIPDSAMRSPGQFTHPLVIRAKCEIAAAALANGIVPAHNVTTELHDISVVYGDARRAREEFGFLRMWSIHPAQIQPIITAMRPDFETVLDAAQLLLAAQAAAWGPISWQGKLHDRASYRYYWTLLQRAHATGVDLPPEVSARFFPEQA